jgi:hypothetical protein
LAPAPVTSGSLAPPSRPWLSGRLFLPGSSLQPLGTCSSIRRLTFADASPLRSCTVAQDCSPVVHRLRLSASAKARLTRRGLTFRRKPQVFGAYGSHACFATHAGILTCLSSTPPCDDASLNRQRSPTAKYFHTPPVASVVDLSPVTLSAQPRLTSELLRTL